MLEDLILNIFDFYEYPRTFTYQTKEPKQSFFIILFISMFTCIQFFVSGVFYTRIASTTRKWKAVVIEKPDSSATSSVDVISPLYISSSGPKNESKILSEKVRFSYQ